MSAEPLLWPCPADPEPHLTERGPCEHGYLIPNGHGLKRGIRQSPPRCHGMVAQ